MKYYECPNCHNESLYPKSKKWVCKDCKQSFSFRQFSRRDLHDKKHIVRTLSSLFIKSHQCHHAHYRHRGLFVILCLFPIAAFLFSCFL